MKNHELTKENEKLAHMLEASSLATSFCLSFIQWRFKDQLTGGEKVILILITILNLFHLTHLIGLDLTEIRDKNEPDRTKNRHIPGDISDSEA